ncbi:uncharacterized protein LOC135471818 [Liolophura sinensis]|uniref:uncharacterized protein LOC135471818 n=1 Tax=Liolophura sinensis TaxID=3198878 RepID=UPI0031596539
MDAYNSLNTVRIYNRQRSSLTKKPWATRVAKTTTSWKNNINFNCRQDQERFGTPTGSQVVIPANRRLFGCIQCVLLPCPAITKEPEVEKKRLEAKYTGSPLRYIGRLVPIDCNVYESTSSNEIYLLYESILFVVTKSYKDLRTRGLQTRLGNLEYYDYLGLMDGKKARPLPQGQAKFPKLSAAATFSEDTFLDLYRTLDIAVNM